MHLLFFYSLRNLLTRRLTTTLTALGMALVVFVFAAIIMLAEGLQKTLIDTGSFDNVVVIRKSSNSEVQSGIDRFQAAIVEIQPEIAMGENARPMTAKEMVVLITLEKKAAGVRSNVVIRGVSEASFPLRPQIRLLAGRLPHPGASEIMVGKSIAKGFKSAGLEESLVFAMRSWRIVGIFDAGSTGYSSEIWGDIDQLMPAFRRQAYSSILFKLRDSGTFETVQFRIQSDPRLTLEAKRETVYYKDQSEAMAKFLRILGISLTLVFSIGAVVGAMITMYAAVATRTAEIGTLRALGFPAGSILMAFLAESLFLGAMGGCVGLFFASFLQFITVSTTNFQTFSELAFSFHLTPGIVIKSLSFSLIMGIVGGVPPAFRASRLNIITALREA
jgi:ABC-type lipoprotein release transport system permease subunit